MFYFSIVLSIPAGHPPPTQLPSDEFHDYDYRYVRVFEIVDSHFPGYAYLELRYVLTECVDDSRYNAVECDGNRWYLSNHCYCNEGDIHGPARLDVHSGSLLTSDSVHCVRCLVWPPQSADWPTRYRNYCWPDSATVDCVVSSGCDVVGVAHRHCRQHGCLDFHDQYAVRPTGSTTAALISLLQPVGNFWYKFALKGYIPLSHFYKILPGGGSPKIAPACQILPL